MADSNEPLPIKDIVNKVISSLSGESRHEEKISKEHIEEAWSRAVGRLAGRRSKPVSLRKNKLVVNVEDSSLLYNLTLRKTEILESLAKDLKDKVKEIQFRIGETGEKRKKTKTSR